MGIEDSLYAQVTSYELSPSFQSVENNIWEKKLQNDSTPFTIYKYKELNKMCSWVKRVTGDSIFKSSSQGQNIFHKHWDMIIERTSTAM
jgi:hypothetical protein